STGRSSPAAPARGSRRTAARTSGCCAMRASSTTCSRAGRPAICASASPAPSSRAARGPRGRRAASPAYRSSASTLARGCRRCGSAACSRSRSSPSASRSSDACRDRSGGGCSTRACGARPGPGARLALVGPIPPRLDIPVPERVERLLAGPGPIVYVAMPSSEPGLVRAAVGALRPLGARILVAGPVADLAGLEDEQVALEGVLPGHLIMPRVDLAVVSGGQGGVQSALAAGVPFAGLPLGPERRLNVALAEREGAARAIAPALAGTPELTAAARALMIVPRHRAAAERLRDAFARADGAGRAAEVIIGLASGVAVHPG